jgi:hypothetical protein
VLQQTLSHVTGRHPDYCIVSLVVGRRAVEQFDANYPFFQAVKITLYGLLDYVAKELLAAVASGKGLPVNHFFKMGSKLSNLR